MSVLWSWSFQTPQLNRIHAQRDCLHFPPCEGRHSKKLAVYHSGEGLPQNLTMLAPWSQSSICRNVRNKFLLFLRFPVYGWLYSSQDILRHSLSALVMWTRNNPKANSLDAWQPSPAIGEPCFHYVPAGTEIVSSFVVTQYWMHLPDFKHLGEKQKIFSDRCSVSQ